MKALEKDRTRRYQTANALALDVRRHLNHEPVIASPPSAAYRVRKFVRRHRVGVTIAATLAMLLTAFAAVTAVQARSIARERDRANNEAATAKQVSAFLVSLFQVSDPNEARGSTLTAREILASGAQRIESSLQDQPVVRARLEATIGTVYTSLGLYSDALPLLRRALESQRRVLGDDDAETMATANSLANVYWHRGQYQDAEPLYKEVVERRTRGLGVEHADTLRASFDLASLYLLQKRWDEAEPLARRTLDSQRRVLGDDHPDTLSSMNNVQAMYYAQKRYSEAEVIAREVLDIRRRVLGPDHPNTITAKHNVASIYDALGRYVEAEKLYGEALEERTRVQGRGHSLTSRTLLLLGSSDVRTHRYKEAEKALLEAHDDLTSSLGAANPETIRSVEHLVKLYAAMGQTDEAQRWRAKLPDASSNLR